MNSENKLKIWYLQPARDWQEALPVGNGRLGGMVFGGTDRELIQLNEISLWSGCRQDSDNPKFLERLSEIRYLLFNGRYSEANLLAEKFLVPKNSSEVHSGDGAHYSYGAYQPLCDLKIFFDGTDWVTWDYRRELDLDTAISRVSYHSVRNVRFTREVFASHPDQVIVVRLSADRPGKFCFNIGLEREFYETLSIVDHNRIIMQGKAHHTNKGLKFECHLLVLPEGGQIKKGGNKLCIENADGATILIAANTSWQGQNPKRVTEAQIESVSN